MEPNTAVILKLSTITVNLTIVEKIEVIEIQIVVADLHNLKQLGP